MHRHGYKGRKFNRERDQRRALIKGLATNLIEHGKIETTLPKAKDIRPYVEKLITKAKDGSLAKRRDIIASLATKAAAHKLVDGIAPQLSARNSGYLRIKRTTLRRGDLAQMAEISFVDALEGKAIPIKPVKVTTPKKSAVKPAVTSASKS